MSLGNSIVIGGEIDEDDHHHLFRFRGRLDDGDKIGNKTAIECRFPNPSTDETETLCPTTSLQVDWLSVCYIRCEPERETCKLPLESD